MKKDNRNIVVKNTTFESPITEAEKRRGVRYIGRVYCDVKATPMKPHIYARYKK